MKDVSPNIAVVQSPKLLDQLRRCLGDKHYSLRTSAFISIGQDDISAFMTSAIRTYGSAGNPGVLDMVFSALVGPQLSRP